MFMPMPNTEDDLTPSSLVGARNLTRYYKGLLLLELSLTWTRCARLSSPVLLCLSR
jgi:hypothetical protein